MANAKTKLLTVRLDESLHQAARLATLANNTTMAEVVREALESWLKDNPVKAVKARKVEKPAKAEKPAKVEKAKKAEVKGGKKKKK